MLRFWILYKVIIRKVYSNRIKGWSSSADNLAFMLVFIQSLTLLFFIESLFNFKAFIYVSLNLNIPIAPLFMGIFAVLYVIFKLMFPFKYDRNSIHLIKESIQIIENRIVTKQKVVLMLIVSLFLFLLSLVGLMI